MIASPLPANRRRPQPAGEVGAEKVGRVVPNAPWPIVSLGSLLREPLRNGHSAKATGTTNGVRTLTLTAVTLGDFSERNTKITSADPGRVSDLWLEPGDILVERSNAPELVGTTRLYRGERNFAIFPDLIIRVRLNQTTDPRFVELVLQSSTLRQYFKSRAKGMSGSMPKIDQQTISDAPIPLPPPDEQREIVAEIEKQFTRLDTGVAALRRTQANLKRYRAAVLKAACEGRLVATDVGWEETTVGQVSTVLAGYGFPERLQGRSRGDFGFFKVGDISEAWKRNEKILMEANHYISKADLAELRAKLLPTGTVVFAKIGAAIALNRRAIIGEPSLVDNNVMGLVAGDRIQPRYLFHFLCTQKLADLARATTVPSIRKGDVECIELKLPPLARLFHTRTDFSIFSCKGCG